MSKSGNELISQQCLSYNLANHLNVEYRAQKITAGVPLFLRCRSVCRDYFAHDFYRRNGR